MKIPVFYDRFEIGQLDVDGQGAVSFAYDPRWQAAAGAFPVSLTMPLSRRDHAPELVHPWIANLLPEESQLATLARRLGVARGDTVAILREIGGDTAGALSFSAPSLREAWDWLPLTRHYQTDDPELALVRHFNDLRQRPFLIGEDGVRLSLAGGQQKSALAVLGPDGPRLGLPAPGDRLVIPRNGAPSTVIIKPDNANLPGIVENEAYCLTLARLIGIPAAPVAIERAGDRSALIVARYDRALRADATIRRLHQEDLAQVRAIAPERKYERGTLPGPSLNDLLTVGSPDWREAFHADATLGGAERARLLDQVIFNILVANTDAHAKNYSLLLDGTPRLAPLYDVSTVLGWDHVNQYHAQNIAGRKRKPGDIARRHWDAIAENAGLNPRQLRLRVQELIDGIVHHGHAAARLVSENPAASRPMVEHFRDLIEVNALRIAGRLHD
ncbi:type II toxin-antitoxin system HipA family toxin [Paracoccus laeviglucosivorans]|uniref:Serine/threonine-protein kinase HipA n=1 Tax=Paracoccus laeviglucosivorans TaxID=1197861 RepID=A0A521FC10_9RHOB|nr:type II toxin-antitoxin system HipA family toxin [Paracoccus laeviglucosivorans]SMO93728.1 serine/threonine-protein kinase HipA [Paracoccus laeviglucosivorans]